MEYRRIIALARRELTSLVAKNDLEEASGLLAELAEICDGRQSDLVAVLRRGISELEQESLLGTISFEEKFRVRNQLADRLLGIARSFFIDSGCEESVDPFSGAGELLPKQQKRIGRKKKLY